MFHKDGSRRRTWKGRAFSLFLSAVLLLGSVPGLVLPASAHWADSYLDQLVDWGVMRADQIADPDTPLTRAEFMAIINRAYGYREMGEMPFTDVTKSDWFYDDVAIAYNAGYMKGTSKTTASPNARLTREQAVCILGRNMMLKETPGEDLAFSDSRDISGWARGMVKTAVNNYIVNGYPDDTFRPKSNITKGQMAVLVTQCVGTPVNASGTYELGDVSGNVTVTSPNVTLRNTTVSGDLYVSGGVGLGGIKLENVNVLGRIVVSGTGESENGSASVIMRNVNANELLVDNMRKKYVTVRADGITEIPKTTVRTNAYLEDNNTDDKGLLNITLEGKSGTQLDLAGRIKNVVDKTPNSFIQVAKGSVQSITVDEDATNSVIQINRNTEVKELNLDVAANVNGEGDVGKLNINAPGSTVTMLPDEIYIRPGITGNVNGIVMDSAAAEESSLDPRLLSGYPAASDVAPTGFRADFAGNKKGTVYWAVSDIADGSIGAEDLISPPSYGSKAVRGGSVGVPAGDTVGSTQISGLTVGGSYYLSAVLVDGREERSPVKVISFTTPDNTVPAFAQGYPYMSLVSNTMAQVTVMPTKTCKLYYAVLLRGAPAPTASELRSASVTGNLGYGIVDVVKNTERVINVSNRLQELKDYTLYLWLTDADGVNSSAVVPVQFRTVDKTPPEFDPDPDPDAAVEENTSVRLTAGLNEQGTIYWVAVPKGRAYPPVNPGSDPIYKDNIMSGAYDDKGNLTDANGGTPVSSRLTSEYAKNQVKNHRGSVTAFGSVAVPNADTEVNIDVRNLKEATAYDLYYVAQDQAGNFSKEVKKITIKTKDTVGPVVTQYFRDTTRGEAVAVPRSSDEVVLKFNEDIKVGGSESLLDLYNNKKTSALKTALEANFKLYYIDDRGTPVLVDSDTKKNTWVDYSKVVVRKVDDGIEVALDPGKKAVKLVSGEEYYFELAKITDLSDNPPKDMTAEAILRYDTVRNTEHVLPRFTIAPASVKLSEPSVNQISVAPVWVANPDKDKPINSQGQVNGGKKQSTGEPLARMDGRFYVDPESTKEMGDTYFYDIVLFSEKAMDYDVYYRVLDPDNKTNPYSPLTELKPATGADPNKKYFDTYYGSSYAGTKKFGAGYNGLSVFDVLASDSDRRDVFNLIVGSSSLTVYGGDGEGGTTRNYSWRKNWYDIVKKNHPDENIEKTEYLILVGGYDSQLGQAEDADISYDKYSFRALLVDLANKSAPQLQYAVGGIGLSWDSTAKRPTASGSVNLQFESDKPIYWRQNNSGTYYLVGSGNNAPSGSGDNGTVGLLYGVTRGHPFTSATGGPTYFSLAFSGTTGGSYTLLPNGSLYAKDGNDPGGPLVVKFTVRSRKTTDSAGNTETEWQGRWDVTYRVGGTTTTVGYEETDWIPESALTGISTTPTPPELTSAAIQFTGSLSATGGNPEATITLTFDKVICSDASGTRIANITTGSTITPAGVTVSQLSSSGTVYRIKVSGITGTTNSTITLLPNTNVYEPTGKAWTYDKVWIVVDIAETGGLASAKYPHVTVYYGNTLVGEKTQS